MIFKACRCSPENCGRPGIFYAIADHEQNHNHTAFFRRGAEEKLVSKSVFFSRNGLKKKSMDANIKLCQKNFDRCRFMKE